ncbi:MAG: cache domain-containing protein [Chloroflexota bacterium]
MRIILNKTINSIGTKIIVPYLLLTLAVAAIGAFIVTNLVTGSLQERFHNQLVDAGRIVSERLVEHEQDRLTVLRMVARTEGVAEAVQAADTDALAAIVPQIIANSDQDAVLLVDNNGDVAFGWQRSVVNPDWQPVSGVNYSDIEDVRLVLDGYVDEIGDKRAFLAETPDGYMLFTVGPVALNGEQMGAVMVGTDLNRLVDDVTQSALARVTLYDQDGYVLGTSLVGLDEAAAALPNNPETYTQVITHLQESPEQYGIVVAGADTQVPLADVEILNQPYQLAFGDWRLRNQSFGLFSVALPIHFILSAAATSRNVLTLVFFLMTMGVFVIGLMLFRRIVDPINRLVETSTAVTQGDLDQRTGIDRKDELGTLARSFDTMTASLAARNQELLEQAGKLEGILQSIADGIIVFDTDNHIITANSAAQAILAELKNDTQVLSGQQTTVNAGQNGHSSTQKRILESDPLTASHRLQIGSRVYSALDAPVKMPDGQRIGRVVALRDITRETEVEELKEGFIASVSHELRTPLTSIKGYTDLLSVSGAQNLSDQQMKFVNVVKVNTDKLIRHVEKLIDIAEIQRGTLNVNRELRSFNQLVEDALIVWSARMAEKKLGFDIEIIDNNLWVDADAVRLTWAMDNLLRNAHDYTLPGGHVQVKVYQEHDQACLSVSDTGIGISRRDQGNLFHRFFRAEQDENLDIPGIGLDLYVAKTLVEVHGGKVWVKSELGVGSTFGLAIPLVHAHMNFISAMAPANQA